MKVCYGSAEYKGPNCGVVTIGVFDGCHIGHQQLIRHVVEKSKKLKHPAILYTFDPHPLEVLAPHKEVRRLFPLKYIIEQTQALGLNYLVIEKFSKEFSSLPSSVFVEKFIYKIFQPSYIIVGEDFRFGFNREGDIQDLEKWSHSYQFQIETVPSVLLKEKTVSSSLVRKVFAESDFSKLSLLLGKPFAIKGKVIPGQSLGRQLGFPTANIHILTSPLPQTGVYICKMKIHNTEYPAVMNWGRRPTLGENLPWTMEIHLLERPSFSLKGEKVEIYPISRIRSEQKFDSKEQLIQAIEKDVQTAQAYFFEK